LLGKQYDWTVWQCIYFSTVTVTTVGYGDYAPESPGGKVAGIFFILIGLMVILSIIQEKVNAWLDAMQKQIIDAADDDDDHETVPHKGAIKIITAVLVLVVVILSGATFYYVVEEEFTFIDAVWWAVCTVSTVGYGDLSLTKEISRIFSIFYIIVGISTFGWTISEIQGVQLQAAEKEKRLKKSKQKLKKETIEKMDEGGDNQVSDGEFLMYCLVDEGRISKIDCKFYLKQFANLDSDNSGNLSVEDLVKGLTNDEEHAMSIEAQEAHAREHEALVKLIMHDRLEAQERRAKQLQCLKVLDIRVHEESVGSIQFKSGGPSSHYIRIKQDQHPLDLYRFMTRPVSEGGWGLSEPELVLSITGSTTTLETSSLTKAFSSTLKNVMDWKHEDGDEEGGSSTWLITGGTEVGVMKLAGEASRGRNTQKSAVLIGVCPWSKVANNSKLKGDQVVDGGPVLYEKTNANSDDSAFLQCNHTHFIFVDTGNVSEEWGTEVNFRYQLEHVIKEQSRAIVEESILKDKVRCLNLTVCFGGGVGSMRSMLHSLMHNIPVVIIADSGGSADALIAALESPSCQKKAEKEELSYEDKLALKLGGSIDRDTGRAEGMKDIDVCRLIAQKRDLIVVYNSGNSQLSLEDSIARALLQKILQVATIRHDTPEYPDSEHEVERREFEALRVMLMRAVRTYRNVDAASFTIEMMTNDGLTTEELDKVIKPEVLQLLKHNRHEFFKLFIDHFEDAGVCIRDLYEMCFDAQYKKPFFYIGNKLQLVRGITDDRCDHEDVFKMLGNVLGRHFKPAKRTADLHDLVLWAACFGRKEIAEAIMPHLSDPLTASMGAAAVVQRFIASFDQLSLYNSNMDELRNLKQVRDRMNDIACQLLQASEDLCPGNTLTAFMVENQACNKGIRRPAPYCGPVYFSKIDLAHAARNFTFLEHPTCKLILSKRILGEHIDNNFACFASDTKTDYLATYIFFLPVTILVPIIGRYQCGLSMLVRTVQGGIIGIVFSHIFVWALSSSDPPPSWQQEHESWYQEAAHGRPLGLVALSFTAAFALAGMVYGKSVAGALASNGIPFGIYRKELYEGTPVAGKVTHASHAVKKAENMTGHFLHQYGDLALARSGYNERLLFFIKTPIFFFAIDFYLYFVAVLCHTYTMLAPMRSPTDPNDNYSWHVAQVLGWWEWIELVLVFFRGVTIVKDMLSRGWIDFSVGLWALLDRSILVLVTVAYFYRFSDQALWCRFFLTVGGMIMWWRLLYYTRDNIDAGTLVNGASRTLAGLRHFALIFLTLSVGFGFSMQGLLFPTGREVWEHSWSIIHVILLQPFEYFLGLGPSTYYDLGHPDMPDGMQCGKGWDLDWRAMEKGGGQEQCFTSRFAMLYVILFMMITTVLLFNILTAKMVKEWKATDDDAWQHFIDNQYMLLRHFEDNPPLAGKMCVNIMGVWGKLLRVISNILSFQNPVSGVISNSTANSRNGVLPLPASIEVNEVVTSESDQEQQQKAQMKVIFSHMHECSRCVFADVVATEMHGLVTSNRALLDKLRLTQLLLRAEGHNPIAGLLQYLPSRSTFNSGRSSQTDGEKIRPEFCIFTTPSIKKNKCTSLQTVDKIVADVTPDLDNFLHISAPQLVQEGMPLRSSTPAIAIATAHEQGMHSPRIQATVVTTGEALADLIGIATSTPRQPPPAQAAALSYQPVVKHTEANDVSASKLVELEGQQQLMSQQLLSQQLHQQRQVEQMGSELKGLHDCIMELDGTLTQEDLRQSMRDSRTITAIQADDTTVLALEKMRIQVADANRYSKILYARDQEVHSSIIKAKKYFKKCHDVDQRIGNVEASVSRVEGGMATVSAKVSGMENQLVGIQSMLAQLLLVQQDTRSEPSARMDKPVVPRGARTAAGQQRQQRQQRQQQQQQQQWQQQQAEAKVQTMAEAKADDELEFSAEGAKLQ
jgi:potassium channel subfamily K